MDYIVHLHVSVENECERLGWDVQPTLNAQAVRLVQLLLSSSLDYLQSVQHK